MIKELKIEIPKGYAIKAFDTKTGIVSWKKDGNIKDRIKNFDDVLEELGSSDEDVIDYKVLSSNNVSKFILASLQIKMIVRVLNEGWIPDWTNNSEYKWYPWAYLYKNGELPLGNCVYYYSNAGCSAHFCFKSEDICKYAFKTFNKEYFEYFKINL